MNTKLASGIVLGVVFASLLVVQQQRISRLSAANADLRALLNQMALFQRSNEDLSKQLKATAESSKANEIELMRLRGQTSRFHQLEKENAQLGNQLQHLGQELREARSVAESSGLPTSAGASVVTSTNSPVPEITDLGSLELGENTPVLFDLGGGTNCIVTPNALPDGAITIQLKTVLTNQDGTVSELARARITAKPGQQASISVGDRMIGLAVKLK